MSIRGCAIGASATAFFNGIAFAGRLGPTRESTGNKFMSDLPSSNVVSIAKRLLASAQPANYAADYVMVPREIVGELQREVLRPSPDETRASHPTAISLRQLADGSDGDMVSFTPNALRAMADAIDGKPEDTRPARRNFIVHEPDCAFTNPDDQRCTCGARDAVSETRNAPKT
jgi:hypothetical protein